MCFLWKVNKINTFSIGGYFVALHLSRTIEAMTVQYTYDASGNPIGVFIPIHEWKIIAEKYPEIEEVAPWEKNLIDQRLDFIKKHPDQLIPIEDFIAELDGNE